MQGAQKWTHSEQQAEDINITVAAIDEQIEQVKHAMADKRLHTVCRATEDMCIPPGCRLEKAITATVDAPASELHCTMVMEVTSLKRVAHQDKHEFDLKSDSKGSDQSDSDKPDQSDSDEPDLIRESESDSEDEESESEEEGVTTVQQDSIPEEEAAVPPMIVRPQITSGARAYVQIAISNEHGTAPLIIRRGDALATLKSVSKDNIKQSTTAVIDLETQLAQQGSAAVITDSKSVEERQAEKAHTEKHRLQEKAEIWDFIKSKSGRQIVQAVKQGKKIGRITLQEWKTEIGAHLKFGPQTTKTQKEDITCVLYALRLVVSKDPKKPGVMKGFEGVIKLVDPNTTPVKCKHRRYSPKEKSHHKGRDTRVTG